MLQNKVVLITGGAGLLGTEFTKSVATQGGTAIIADINEKIGLETKLAISKELGSSSVDFIQMDITSKLSLNNAIQKINALYGRIDALVNNAYPRNRNYGRSFFEVEYEDFCENINLNLGGYFLTSQQFAKFFIEQGHGNIINISSIYGVIPPRFEVYENTTMTMPIEYAAIKSALIHLTKFMAKSLKGKNIRVNALSPGGIFDHQQEAFLKAYNAFCLNKGMLETKDMVGALTFLLSDASKHMNGQNIIIDDGFTL